MVAGSTFALTLYAFTTKTDYTYCGGAIWIFLFSLFFFSFFFFFMDYEVARVGFSIIGVILYSFYLIYDTQLIIGGKRFELSLDDYVIASMILYIDIIQLFLYLLRLFG